MRLVRYRYEKRESYGALSNNDKIICLPALAKRLNKVFPKNFEEFIGKSDRTLKIVEDLLWKAPQGIIADVSFSFEKAVLLAPITRPPKIICLGLNYLDHIEESTTEHGALIPDEPIIFMKPRTTIIGPYDEIVKPTFVRKLDYEAELAVIIGKKAKNVDVSEAKSCIFGYTILNDVSARDIQFKDVQWTRGKSFDTFAPTGPCIVTEDQLDASDLRIRTWVNGELRQDSKTRNMVFNVYQIVQHLSRVMTLEPFDIIATGTPGGVGFAMKPEPKFLHDGDIVRIEIENIGVIENRVVEEKL